MKGSHVERLALLRPFVGRLAVGLLVMALTVAVQLAYPQALAYFIDHLGAYRDGRGYGRLALAMLALLMLQAGATALRYYLFESTGYMIVTRIRRLVYEALLQQQIAFFDKHNVGALMSRLTADVEVLHDTLSMGLAIAIRSCCVCVGGIALLLATSPLLSSMLVFFIPASLYLARWAGRDLRGRAQRIQECQADSGQVAHEHLSNIRLVHAFNQQRTAARRYLSATERALSVSVQSTRLFALFRGGSSLLVYLALLLTLWLGAELIRRGTLSIGALTAFILYAGMVSESAGAVSDFWSEWMRTIGATERIFEFVRARRESGGRDEQRRGKVQLKGRVEFEDVLFAYPERPEKPALAGISFAVEPGERLALVGASGAGKSTIANLILGFYAPDRGRVLLDGRDARWLPIDDVRDSIAIVEQEPALFSGSIAENIAFAVSDREPSRAELIDAARLARAHEFIASFPRGYDTIVGDRGVQLSGGQKQRIAIARAVLRDPRILILDEATSALDSASELLVQQALDTLMAGRTTIIIAHRYSTIVESDRIVVLNDGAVVQQGTHEQLVQQRGGLYFRLMENQLAQYRQASFASAGQPSDAT